VTVRDEPLQFNETKVHLMFILAALLADDAEPPPTRAEIEARWERFRAERMPGLRAAAQHVGLANAATVARAAVSEWFGTETAEGKG
jgi:hypothetical protein